MKFFHNPIASETHVTFSKLQSLLPEQQILANILRLSQGAQGYCPLGKK